MLKYPVPGVGRRVGGVAVAVALCISGVYAVTAASGAALNPDTSASAPAGAAQVTGDAWLAQLMDLDVHNQNFAEVLRLIARKTGHTVVFSDRAEQRLKDHPDPVQMHFVQLQVKALLELISKVEGLSIRQSGDVIYVDVPH